MSNSIIRSALESRLKTWADSQVPPIPIAYQNVPFTPPAGRYIRAYLLPAETSSRLVEGTDRSYIGMFQMSVCVPDGTGPGASEQIVASLETLFSSPLTISKSGLNIRITRPLSVSPAMQEHGLYVIPTRTQYRVDKTI